MAKNYLFLFTHIIWIWTNRQIKIFPVIQMYRLDPVKKEIPGSWIYDRHKKENP